MDAEPGIVLQRSIYHDGTLVGRTELRDISTEPVPTQNFRIDSGDFRPETGNPLQDALACVEGTAASLTRG